DAALHAALLEGGGAGVRVPFAWSGVRLGASGGSSLRVRLAPAADDAVSLTGVDETGTPVGSVEALRTRPLRRRQLENARRARRESLFRLDWVELEPASVNGTPRSFALLGDGLDLATAGIDAQPHRDLDALRQAIDRDTHPPHVVLGRAGARAG